MTRRRPVPGAPGRDGEQGATLVEFALTVVLLLTVVLGVMAISLALYSYNVVSEAAREGARYAIVRGATSCADATPDCNVGTLDVQSYIRGLGFPGINPSRLTANSIWSSTTPGAICAPSAACNNPGNQVQVTVVYKFPLQIPFIPERILTMSNSAQMVISQ